MPAVRSSKDLAKRLRFDFFPRGDVFRRRYAVVGIVVTLLGVVLWAVLTMTLRQRQYVPGPVSLNHATFGDRCEVCHATPFVAVKNASCEECHGRRVHSTFEQRTPECSECHAEHRDVGTLLAVANGRCIACHGDLHTSNPAPMLQKAVASFAAHPELVPMREPAGDRAAIRFNHKLHLTSPDAVDRSADNRKSKKLTCASCHVPDTRGRLMRPIAFVRDCQRCHKQEVTGARAADSGSSADDGKALPVAIEALHAAPEVIRPDLMAKLFVVAVEHPEIFEAQDSRLPGIRGRPPVDASRTLREYQMAWIERLESELYQPFDDRQRLLEHNKRCFLCHVQTGTRAAGALPVVAASKIPTRWLARGEFAHGRHEMLPCATCHAGVEKSSATADTNLPARDVCERCHVDGNSRSAGTDCALCHLYHDTSKDRAVHVRNRKEVSLDTLEARTKVP
jgi:hypothetical protein